MATKAPLPRVRQGKRVLRVTKDRTLEVEEAMRALTNREVLVGVPAMTATRIGGLFYRDASGKKVRADAKINNAALAYIHEFGAPRANIPPRPFLIPGIESVRGEIVARLKAAAQAALRGGQTMATALGPLNAVGLIAVAAVQRKIANGPFIPLAPRTLAKRRARGNMSDKPLIDTGSLRRSITYVIRRRKGEPMIGVRAPRRGGE